MRGSQYACMYVCTYVCKYMCVCLCMWYVHVYVRKQLLAEDPLYQRKACGAHFDCERHIGGYEITKVGRSVNDYGPSYRMVAQEHDLIGKHTLSHASTRSHTQTHALTRSHTQAHSLTRTHHIQEAQHSTGNICHLVAANFPPQNQ